MFGLAAEWAFVILLLLPFPVLVGAVLPPFFLVLLVKHGSIPKAWFVLGGRPIPSVLALSSLATLFLVLSGLGGQLIREVLWPIEFVADIGADDLRVHMLLQAAAFLVDVFLGLCLALGLQRWATFAFLRENALRIAAIVAFSSVHAVMEPLVLAMSYGLPLGIGGAALDALLGPIATLRLLLGTLLDLLDDPAAFFGFWRDFVRDSLGFPFGWEPYLAAVAMAVTGVAAIRNGHRGGAAARTQSPA
jgi:hypothetical protein